MQGSIAQTVALAIHGNAALQGAPEFSGADFYPTNSTFRYCASVTYSDSRNDGGGIHPASRYADDPLAWISRIKREGARGLRVRYRASGGTQVPDRVMVGFVGGGGTWSIDEIGQRAGCWQGLWQLGDRQRRDQKIWQVDYRCVVGDQPPASQPADDLDELKERFGSCLRRAALFARSHKFLMTFSESLESGLSRLAAASPYDGLFHRDLAPPGFLPLSANQLLAAAQDAWVFGGMGSWNDVGSFSERDVQIQYEQLSEELYQLLNRVVVAGANSKAAE
jgi:hypothetical protein